MENYSVPSVWYLRACTGQPAPTGSTCVHCLLQDQLGMTTEKRKRERKAGGRVGECKSEGIERVTKMKQTPYWLLTNVSSYFAAWYKLLTSEFSLNKTLTYSPKENWTAARETLHWYTNNTITDLGMTRERETEKSYLSHLKQNVCWRIVWAGRKGQVLLSTACALQFIWWVF